MIIIIFFKWKDNSCSFDSFLAIFINSVFPIVNISPLIKNDKFEKEYEKYDLYIKFIT